MSYQLTLPFNIDDDQLEGVRADLAFVLGVEWAMCYAWLKNGGKGIFTAHTKNAARLVALGGHLGFVVSSVQLCAIWSTIRAVKAKGIA